MLNFSILSHFRRTPGFDLYKHVGAISMDIGVSKMPKMLRRSQPLNTYVIVGLGVIS